MTLVLTEGAHMACIIKKVRQGRAYYYAAESARVKGKPRIVWQKYLGTLDTILERANKDSQTGLKEVEIFEAGSVAAMLRIVEKIGLVEIIDSVIPKRDQGPTVGQYIALAAINRVVDPCSKLQMPDWYHGTVLQRLWKFAPDSFTSQRFWDHMTFVSEKAIEEIQDRIALKVKDHYQIDPEILLFDTTNFFTYIATTNDRNKIAQRGKSKAKRNDLRQVGLALVVTKDYHIPLFHKVYQGHIPDVSVFPDVAQELKHKQIKTLGTYKEATLVFDKGNISEDAMESLIVSNQHFVCAVPKTTCLELFSTPLEKFQPVSDLPGTRGFSAEVNLWHKQFVTVVTYTESLFAGQIHSITTSLQKCQKKLEELQRNLLKWQEGSKKGRRPTLQNVKDSVDRILLSGDFLKQFVKTAIQEKNGLPTLGYYVDQDALEHLQKHVLGRTLIISTRTDWSASEIIKAYRGQNEIETAFKELKNREFLHWQPAYHWTDQKVKVHGFYCVLALLLATLAHRTVRQGGIDLSLPAMLKELSKIREVAVVFDTKNRSGKKPGLSLSKMSPIQKKLAQCLEVGEVLGGNTPS